MSLHTYAQIDTAFIARLKMLDTANILGLDTTDVLNDKLTKKILELKKEKTGIGLESIMYIKIMEEKQKPNSKRTTDFFNRLQQEITSGRTSSLIDNCFVNIYRRTFTETEIDDLIRFYKSPAGKKMEREFLPLLVESAKAAELLLEMAAKKIEQAAQ
jgi:hypothetical protein